MDTNTSLLHHPFSGLLFESLPLGVVVQDSAGQIVTANPAAQRILGLSLDQMRGITSVDPRWYAVHEDGSPFPGKEHPAMVVIETGQTVPDTVMGVFNPELSDQTWININAFPIQDDVTGSIQGAYAIFEDITARTKAQQKKEESEERFRSLFFSMSEGVALHKLIYDEFGQAKDYLILDVNPAFEKQTGLARESVLGKGAKQAYGTPEAPFLEIYAGVAQSQKPTSFEAEFAQLGKHFSISVFSPRRDHFATVFSDVTERHRTETALKATQAELAEAQHLAHIGSWYWDATTDHNKVSDEICRIYGRDSIPPFAQQKGLMYGEDTWQQLNAAVQEATRTGIGYNLELPALRGDGTTFWINTRCAVVHNDAGEVIGLRGTVQDITESKHAQEALLRSLEEKQALLHEVHHRVKNNLQVIVSLLRLEARRSTLADIQAVLNDMQGRIRSMALLHESLYRSGVFASIELGNYLRGLATQVFRGQTNASGSVRLVVEFTPVQVSMDLATPCGLLVNELVSNCLKHGFPKNHAGEVKVELHPANRSTSTVDALWRLCVSDNGTGLPPDFEAKRKASLGLQLVGDLSRQMNGTLAIQSQPGTGAEFAVIFKI